MKDKDENLLPGHPPECYACGTENPASMPIEFRELGDRVVTDITFEATHTGAPGFAHGGSIATALDDTIGTLVVARLEQVGVTAKLEIEYRQPVLLDVPMRIESWIKDQEGRKVWTTAELRDAHGDLYAVAHGLWVLVESSHFQGDADPAGLWLARRRAGEPDGQR